MANLETLSALEKRINLAIPVQQVEAEVDTRLQKLARTVKLHGFRPGKVPFKIVAQQFGQQVRQEVLGDNLQKSFSAAVKAQNLRVAGQPKIEAKTLPESAQAFEFSATFEVYPEVKLGSLADVKFERPVVTVGEDEVSSTIEVLRKQRARYETVESPIKNGDKVVFDYRAVVAGDESASREAKDTEIIVGEGKTLPGFEPQLIGLKAGDNKDFELNFPTDASDTNLAGKSAKFQVTIKTVSKPILPNVDEIFAKDLGVEDGSLESMRQEIKENLQREVKKRVQARVKESVVQTLLDKTPLELPHALIEAEQRFMRAQADDAAAAPAADLEAMARSRVSWGLILTELVRSHDLQPKAPEVRKLIEEYAVGYERPQEVISWYYSDPKNLQEVETLVAENNVIEWALTQGQVVDIPVSFDKLMGNEHGK